MPAKNPKLKIRMDLLRPQSNPEKIPVKALRWLLSTGRYIFIFVEGLVLIAFILRFKLDADLASKKEAIEQQIPYIQSLKPFEIQIRETQLKLKTLDAANQSLPNYPQILQELATQTPLGVKIISLALDKNVGKVNFQINAQSNTSSDLSSFVAGLKQDPFFADINLSEVGFEQSVIHFTINGSAKTLTQGLQKL